MLQTRTAVIVGSRGQDGTLLSRKLIAQGVRVIGIGRCGATLDGVDLEKGVNITSAVSVIRFMEEWSPSEIYYLAAYHGSSEDPIGHNSVDELFRRSQEIHVTGLVNFLAAISKVSQGTKLFYAGSSLVFGRQHGQVQDEFTPYDPSGTYGITKAQGLWMCREYRDNHGIPVFTGILYNHESYLRPVTFLTAKVIQSAIRIAKGSQERLKVGNLAAQVDWGLAIDYVAAFEAVLHHGCPGDYIIATGVKHSVEEFVSSVFGYFQLDWRKHVDVNSGILVRQGSSGQANPAKLARDTGIKLARPFQELVNALVRDHIALLESSSS